MDYGKPYYQIFTIPCLRSFILIQSGYSCTLDEGPSSLSQLKTLAEKFTVHIPPHALRSCRLDSLPRSLDIRLLKFTEPLWYECRRTQRQSRLMVVPYPCLHYDDSDIDGVDYIQEKQYCKLSSPYFKASR